MEIPHTQLTAAVLDAVIEEFITREGTDYGEEEISLAQKVMQVREQLERREIFLSFDAHSQTCQLLPISARVENEL